MAAAAGRSHPLLLVLHPHAVWPLQAQAKLTLRQQGLFPVPQWKQARMAELSAAAGY